MTKAFISFFLIISTMLASLIGIGDKANVKVPESNFEPVLRFAVASDVHTENFGDTSSKRLKKFVKTAYKIAEQNNSYNSLDAVMLAGDITDNGKLSQFIAFKATLNSCIEDGTKVLAIAAHSHDGSTYKSSSTAKFTEVTGLPSDFHYVINGYHFIGLSAGWTDDNGQNYDESQRVWLREQLNEAVADDPSKPIFVMQHEHILNTVYGSSSFDGWGIDYFTDILSDYPQVVNFSGHSHYPINDPRSIWQGSFTAIGTGALKYAEFTVDDQRVVHPENNDKMAQMWIVEVDANNRIRLCGYDALSGSMLCEYLISDPAAPNKSEFTPEKQEARSSAPEFGDNAELKIKAAAGKLNVTFPSANSTDGFPVFLYRVNIYGENGELISSDWKLNEYWHMPFPDTISVTVAKPATNNYTVKVTAENAYGMSSAAVVSK